MLAFLTLLVGYVNRDAKRRGMSAALWTILVIFIPNAIGFILYFLMRQQLRVPCPGCGAALQPSANYCPSCGAHLRPVCPECRRAIEPGDKFCANCGHELRQGTARLQQA
jgi:predicted amidophosphoribosyltransferase